ncbi:MAG TPA: gamma-glutamyltransferase, partial [Longimicrobiales bacterium]|nr:gamma-glutamyltransferase [Longimicrobiales bacterium]
MTRDPTGATRRRLGGLALALSAAACATAPALFPAAWPYPADARPVTAARAMVVTTDDYASEVGLDVLRRGGNAVDAAVAVHFALAVVNPA